MSSYLQSQSWCRWFFHYQPSWSAQRWYRVGRQHLASQIQRIELLQKRRRAGKEGSKSEISWLYYCCCVVVCGFTSVCSSTNFEFMRAWVNWENFLDLVFVLASQSTDFYLDHSYKEIIMSVGTNEHRNDETLIISSTTLGKHCEEEHDDMRMILILLPATLFILVKE